MDKIALGPIVQASVQSCIDQIVPVELAIYNVKLELTHVSMLCINLETSSSPANSITLSTC